MAMNQGNSDPQTVPRPFRPSWRGNQYFRYSPLLRREIRPASKLEYEASWLLDWDPDVQVYCEQPDIQVHAWIDGVLHKSRPDYWIRYHDGTQAIEEVKYDAELKKPSSRANRQIKIQRTFSDHNGFKHIVMLESMIWRNPTLINSLRILMADFNIEYPSIIEKAQEYNDTLSTEIASRPGTQIHQIEAKLFHGRETASVRLLIFDLIRTRALEARIDQVVLSPWSRLYLPGRISSPP
jgi:hypothetical protein